MSHPLPLVTITLTTDEMAMASAALILLRQHWQKAQSVDPEAVGKMTMKIEAFRQRLDESVTEDQGRALLSELVSDLKRRNGMDQY